MTPPPWPLALSQAWAKAPSADATASTPPAQTVAPSSAGAQGSTAPAPGPVAAAAPTPSIVPATVATAAVVAPPAPRRIDPPATATTGGRGRRICLDGVVESVAGSRQDTPVSVYGYPLEHRFQAAGYIQTNQTSPGGPEPRVPAQANR